MGHLVQNWLDKWLSIIYVSHPSNGTATFQGQRPNLSHVFWNSTSSTKSNQHEFYLKYLPFLQWPVTPQVCGLKHLCYLLCALLCCISMPDHCKHKWCPIQQVASHSIHQNQFEFHLRRGADYRGRGGLLLSWTKGFQLSLRPTPHCLPFL